MRLGDTNKRPGIVFYTYSVSSIEAMVGLCRHDRAPGTVNRANDSSSSVGNARIEGLLDDLNMSMSPLANIQRLFLTRNFLAGGDRYLVGLSLYFVGYVLFEV